MKSCDLAVVSSKIEGLDYEDAVLCAGLCNRVNIMSYASNNLYILQGRGICFIDELLSGIDVDYSLLNYHELLTRKDIDIQRLIVVLPYVSFDKIRHMKTNVVQFFHTYGTYQVKDIDEEKLLLEGDYDEGMTEKVIYFEDLKRLSLMSVKPLGISYKIIYLEQRTTNQESIHKCIRNSIRKLIQSDYCKDSDGEWCQGKQFYKKVQDILNNYWNSEFNKVAKYIFIQSIQNGSSFFYRREFSDALLKKYNIEQKELIRAGNYWRKLSRYLKSLVEEEKDLEIEIISEIMSQIEIIEMNVFMCLEGEI